MSTPKVYWLIKAQDMLEESVNSRALCASGNERPGTTGVGDPDIARRALDEAYCKLASRLEKKLMGTFPHAEVVIVLDCLGGYTLRNGSFVLRVEEITKAGKPFARIVKIADPDSVLVSAGGRTRVGKDPRAALGRELRGWTACQRRGNERGRIFMHLLPGLRTPGRRGLYETLIYEDAQQILRAAEVVSLEHAVLESCQWGRPPARSIASVTKQIFAEMTDRFYRRSRTEKPQAETSAFWRKRLESGSKAWGAKDSPWGVSRNDALAFLSDEEKEWLDPLSYMEQMLKDCEKGTRRLPEMQRGFVHGDLHARNILVGLIDGEAVWPAIYDYEDMGCDGYLGWDFVKLECELKVRALSLIFHGDDDSFVKDVYRFEVDLAEETEGRNNEPVWENETDVGKGAEALRLILLEIRRMARICLETHRGRNRRWLDEYYFLLTCYGLYSGRFPNYQRRHLLAAYTCSGVAAYRFAWSRCVADKQERRAREQALKAIGNNRPATKADIRHPVRYHAELAFAKEFARSRKRDFVQAAIGQLEDLRKKHNYVPMIGQELALALLELSVLDPPNRLSCETRVERLLEELVDQFPSKDPELLCRSGRLWKDRGDLAFEGDTQRDMKPDPGRANAYYRRALRWYEEACETAGSGDGWYYPAINRATLHWLVGDRKKARQLAREILTFLEHTERGKQWGDDLIWVLATRAEANLLLGDVDVAARLYREAIHTPHCTPQAAESMGAQVRRILRKARGSKARFKDFADIFSLAPAS